MNTRDYEPVARKTQRTIDHRGWAKYELILNDTIVTPEGKTLYRIRAIADFGNVKAGQLGGYIESESNLSHKSDCWVYDGAMVYDDAHILGDARIFDQAKVYGHAIVCDEAWVYGQAEVFGHASVGDMVRILGCAKVHGSIRVYGEAWIFDSTVISDND